ncbi:hypothetical protein XA68_14971 [Ophiocordyceps unilateralis]|uniref:Uncharacterized protein n=1 Tax=Ophiocordyceps unilateralis TaxID=268505 RepID=A0A2A9PMM9_OPHUN|nr:hypothetical protein XA68_14971 [Ophiocordyceps unilateralis]
MTSEPAAFFRPPPFLRGATRQKEGRSESAVSDSINSRFLPSRCNRRPISQSLRIGAVARDPPWRITLWTKDPSGSGADAPGSARGGNGQPRLSETAMFCLRSWLPLLFIPTNASPAFIFLFFVCTYFLNRPCVYCSILLLILFLTSCNWSDHCFFDFRSNWFLPRPNVTTGLDDDGSVFNATVVEMLTSTAKAIASAAADDIASRRAEWTGLGMEWLRSLLGRREWRVDCMDIYIRL